MTPKARFLAAMRNQQPDRVPCTLRDSSAEERSAMAKAAEVPTMLHSCGKSRALVDMLCEDTDVNCINPLEIAPMGDVDLAEVKQARDHKRMRGVREDRTDRR